MEPEKFKLKVRADDVAAKIDNSIKDDSYTRSDRVAEIEAEEYERWDGMS